MKSWERESVSLFWPGMLRCPYLISHHSTDSTVYKGRKKKSIAYYAIKSVDKDQKARVLQEVCMLLQHDRHAWTHLRMHGLPPDP